MSDFFDSEIIQEELSEINEMQEKIYESFISFGRMSREQKLEHVEILTTLLEKQQVMYTRLSLSDDPKAIEMKEWRVLGSLINQSHASLRDDYEVSCPELDTIVSLAQAQKGVLGARLTGGGFGGCAIALCQKNSAQSWQKVVEEAYREIFGYNPSIFEAKFSQGVKLTRLSSESK